MLAEEELNFIFCKSKKFGNSSGFNCASSATAMTQWSFSTNASKKTSESSLSSEAAISNFDLHLEVPLERPSCNPFAKGDEGEFMIIYPSYDVVVETEFTGELRAGLVPCDTQVLY